MNFEYVVEKLEVQNISKVKLFFDIMLSNSKRSRRYNIKKINILKSRFKKHFSHGYSLKFWIFKCAKSKHSGREFNPPVEFRVVNFLR